MDLELLKKIKLILGKKQRVKMAGLMVMILIGGLLETAGVSLLLPVVSAIMDEESFAANEYVIMVMGWFGMSEVKTLVYLLLFALAFMYIFKNAFLIFLNYLQSRFVFKNRSQCSTNLLSLYLNKPYEFYLYAETSVIVQNLYNDMENSFNLLLQFMNMMAELIVTICLSVFLLIVDPKLMIVVVTLLGIVTLFILKSIKPRLRKAGDDVRTSLAGVYKWILQPVTGIKDVKVFDKSGYFVRRFYKYADDYATNLIKNNVFTGLPRLLIETIAIVGILAYIGVSMAAGIDSAKIVPLISAFALAAMRLLPSVNRVNTYIANIAYFEPALNNISKVIDGETRQAFEQPLQFDLGGVADSNAKEIEINKEVKLSGIEFAYPNTEVKLFDGADMVVPVGKSVGVMGPSGSGKTTIIDILLGLLKVQKGEITCDGVNIFDNYGSWLSKVGYIPQNIYMLDASIKENIAFGVPVDQIDEDRVWKVLEEAQMKEFVQSQPEGINSQIGESGVRISGGQRQRLGIARALYHDPELLVFDEATSALDNDTETAIMEAVDALHGHKTMVIIAHRLRTIENCDIIYEVKDGKITRV